jgi:UDP:flavonoid glycosyltransferase YjiC (YdhE family)
MARILITCLGSLGDLHPYLALGAGLRQRGHAVAIASSGIYGPRIAAAGLGFVPLRTRLDQYAAPAMAAGFIARIFDPRQGPQTLVREMMAGFAQTYDDTREAVAGCDLVISHPLTYATPIVCTELDKRWLSTALAPMSFLSAFDPPFLAAAPWLRPLRAVSPALFRAVLRLAKRWSRSLVRPVYAQCRARGLPPPRGNPLFEGQFSPDPQPDWPARTTLVGFPFHAQDATPEPTGARLRQFLSAGEPPLVFALGSSAVEIAGDFFAVAARIAQVLDRRAVLVAGSQAERYRALEAHGAVIALDYVAYDDLFAHASLVVHQGGIGTLARAARAGKPTLVVPFGFDQFDNAERIVRRGGARMVRREQFTVGRAAPLLAQLLADATLARAAAATAERLAGETGVANACDIVEACIAT